MRRRVELGKIQISASSIGYLFGYLRVLARIIHDGSWRNRAVALRDGHAEPRGLALPSSAVPVPLLARMGTGAKVRSAPVPNSMLTDRAVSPPVWTPGHRVQTCRSSESAIAAEVFMNNAG